MAIEFDCPTCQTRIRTPAEAAGKKARCPTCQAIVPIPAGPGTSQPGNFGSYSSSALPLPSAVYSPPKADITSAAASVNPPAPAPWLPPADAFAPKGPGGSNYPRPGYGGYAPPPVSSNPFSDPLSDPKGGPLNPYASPSGYASADMYALTKDEVRQKLLGPAIGITLAAFLSMGTVALLGLAMWMDPDFHQDMKQGAQNDPGAVAFAYFFLFLFGFVAVFPSLISLIGVWAMVRGRGLVAAWIGAIAAVLPCNPWFFLGAGFGIWGMVVLNDTRVQEGMK